MPPSLAPSVLAWAVPVVALAFAAGYVVLLYNGLVQLKNDCDRAWSNIDVLLKQRFDEIPNLVRVCKEYIRHERRTLVDVINARQIGMEAAGTEDVAQADHETRQALGRLFAVAERYPDLKANERFAALQNRISGLESEIADRREFFNACVTNYNTRIEQVPDVFVARWIGCAQRALLTFTNVEIPGELGFDDELDLTGTSN